MSVKVSLEREEVMKAVGVLGCHQVNTYLLANPCAAFEYLSDGLELLMFAMDAEAMLDNCEVVLLKETNLQDNATRVGLDVLIEGGASFSIRPPATA